MREQSAPAQSFEHRPDDALFGPGLVQRCGIGDLREYIAQSSFDRGEFGLGERSPGARLCEAASEKVLREKRADGRRRAIPESRPISATDITLGRTT